MKNSLFIDDNLPFFISEQDYLLKNNNLNVKNLNIYTFLKYLSINRIDKENIEKNINENIYYKIGIKEILFNLNKNRNTNMDNYINDLLFIEDKKIKELGKYTYEYFINILNDKNVYKDNFKILLNNNDLNEKDYTILFDLIDNIDLILIYNNEDNLLKIINRDGFEIYDKSNMKNIKQNKNSFIIESNLEEAIELFLTINENDIKDEKKYEKSLLEKIINVFFFKEDEEDERDKSIDNNFIIEIEKVFYDKLKELIGFYKEDKKELYHIYDIVKDIFSNDKELGKFKEYIEKEKSLENSKNKTKTKELLF